MDKTGRASSVEELLTRGVANIIPNADALRETLNSGKKLNVYLGIDPTMTNIHLGHAVPLRKLQALAELGHNVTFLIGDFTALIGDTSDKDSERPVLTSEKIEENFKTYKDQAEKILDFSKVKVRHNSEWLDSLTFKEIVKLCQHFSFGDFASRELIKKRLTEGKKVGLHEALYPVMQGYDSYFMDTDIQLGGTDQTFNMQAGRVLQKDLRSKESFVLANAFLSGTDGKKMSKTGGNAIWLTEKPNEMYTKVMAINDDVIVEYWTLGTNIPLEQINEIEEKLKSEENPMQVKKQLAHTIVSELHSEDAANVAQGEFEKVHQKGGTPTKMSALDSSTLPSDATIIDAIMAAGLAKSRADAKRVITQGGVAINDTTITDPNSPFNAQPGDILKYGKHEFREIK
ncbi:tyrosine--tRNA ligase [Candidatus Microgenomates bacterium]|nr:tyrosine--tRNA ligase [Candidatus Microgenomates bacterium]